MGHSRTEKQMLYDKNPYCTWCGVKMNFYEHIEGTPIPDDAVTTDHLYPITDPRRQWHKKHKTPSPIVLCCRRCNMERGDIPPEIQEKLTQKTRSTWMIFFYVGNSQFQTT